MENSTRNFYRRHGKQCRGGHPARSMSYEQTERSKGWKRCDCPIQVSGVIGGNFVRKATGEVDWDRARATVEKWDGNAAAADSAPRLRPDPAKIPIEDAVEKYLDSHAESAYSTRRQYRYQMEAFKLASTKLGYLYLDQWTVSDIRDYRESWGNSALTKTKKMATIKAFYQFAMEMEWIDRNVAKVLKNRRTRDEKEETERIPFSDEELEIMYAACREKWVKGYGYTRWFKYDGEALADFISLSVYTGLRISDVVKFHISKLKDNGDVEVRMTKTGKPVYCWIPEWLQDRLRQRSKDIGPYVFGYDRHAVEDENTIIDQWRRRLKALWALCEPFKEKPTPHRFRHTFARVLLQQPGMTLRYVAEALGNTETIVRKHYAAWVPERQEKLSHTLREAFKDKPRPGNVIVFKKAG